MATRERGDTLRVAAVGLGWVTQNRHLPTMARQSNIDVVGVIDRHPGRAASIAASFGLKRSAECAKLSDVDWLDEVDAITIGTAPFSHYDLVCEALALGKHVLTEKPFTMTRGEADDLVTRSEAGRGRNHRGVRRCLDGGSRSPQGRSWDDRRSHRRRQWQHRRQPDAGPRAGKAP